jgi:DNA-binding response OmpR family regulator
MEKTNSRILLIDDDREFVQSVSDILKQEGWSVFPAYTGEEGIKAASGLNPDLVILDVMLSYETEGFDISRRILATPQLKGLPIILLTGISKELSLPFQLLPDESWLPVAEILPKPVDPAALISTIRSKLERGERGVQ